MGELIKTSSSDETKLVSEMLWNNCEDEAEKRRKERETEREKRTLKEWVCVKDSACACVRTKYQSKVTAI